MILPESILENSPKAGVIAGFFQIIFRWGDWRISVKPEKSL
jgi:hypothetical protein